MGVKVKKEDLKQGLLELFKDIEIRHEEPSYLPPGKQVKLLFINKIGIPFFTLEVQKTAMAKNGKKINYITCKIDVSVREVYTKLLGYPSNKRYYMTENQVIRLWNVFMEVFNETFKEKIGIEIPSNKDWSETECSLEIPKWIKNRIKPYDGNIDFTESNELSLKKVREVSDSNLEVVSSF
jgi:hypothetical protein